MGLARDMGLRLVEAAQQLTGREVAPQGTLDLVESVQSDNRLLRKTLEFVGFRLFNFQQGAPNEMKPEARRLSIQKALTAYAEDPNAGEYVDLYVSFVFGRGVPRPQAHDDDVQQRLDETWDDPANKRILTSFEKLIENGVDYLIQSNVLLLLFDDGDDGRVRLSRLPFGDIQGVRRHPRDHYRILYYKVLERPPSAYDWQRGAETVPVGNTPTTLPKLVYYEAVDAFDEENPVMAAQDAGIESQLRPPQGLTRPGRVLHLAANKTSDDAFGIPGMRRLLRWWTANNEVLNSHVDRMKAMARIYMTATVQGDQRDVDRIGEMATGRPSVFGAAAARDPNLPTPGQPAGGILGANAGLKYEPFKIDSGAADVASSLPQIRSQFSGPFPPTYYGQEAGALAGAQSMELPVLKFCEREQELWAEGIFRRLADRAIERAVEVGDIDEYRDPTDEEQARIDAASQAGIEPEGLEVDQDGQVKRDLGYEFSFPSPLKRAMGDLVSAAIQVATAVDPNGENVDLSRWLLGFCLAEAFDITDPQRLVDQLLPRDLAKAALEGNALVNPETGEVEPIEGSVGPDGQRHPPDNPGGAPRKTPEPEDRKLSEAGRHGPRATRRTRERQADAEEDFDSVLRVAREQLGRLADVGSTNGNQPH